MPYEIGQEITEKMAKDKKITLLEVYKKVRRFWDNRNPKTQIQKNKKKGKSRQQQKIDLRKEDY